MLRSVVLVAWTVNITKPLCLSFCFRVTINFIMEDGEKRSVQAKVGDNLLDIIIEHDVDIDGFGQYKS